MDRHTSRGKFSNLWRSTGINFNRDISSFHLGGLTAATVQPSSLIGGDASKLKKMVAKWKRYLIMEEAFTAGNRYTTLRWFNKFFFFVDASPHSGDH